MPDIRYSVLVGERILELDYGTARFAVRSGRGVWVDEYERPITNGRGEPALPGALDEDPED